MDVILLFFVILFFSFIFAVVRGIMLGNAIKNWFYRQGK